MFGLTSDATITRCLYLINKFIENRIIYLDRKDLERAHFKCRFLLFIYF